jgi:hypothetical protein
MTGQLDSQTLFFWILAYIVVPFVLPPVGILLIRLLPPAVTMPPAARRIITVVKDGQLGWVTIAIGCALFYDLWDFTRQTGVRVTELMTELQAANEAKRTEAAVDLGKHLLYVLHVRSPSFSVHLVELATFCIVVGLTMATAIGAAFPTAFQSTFAGGWRHALLHYHMLVGTAIVSAIGAGGYIAIHIWIMLHDVT